MLINDGEGTKMTLYNKLKYSEKSLEFPPYKRRFKTIMEKDMYVRAVGLKIQNEVLRDWNPFRDFWDNEEDKFWDTLEDKE